MVTMVMRAFALGQSATKSSFADKDSIPSWATGYIAKAVELGIVNGYADNTFKADQQVTRAEFFKVIALCLEQKSKTQ